MSRESGQHQVAIVGKNNTKVAVTGQNELVIKISDTNVTTLADAIALANTTTTGTNITTVSIPTVAAVPVTNWNAATAFTSDIISFQDRNKIAPWAFQIAAYAIVSGTPTLTLQVSLNGTDFTNYKAASTLIDMTDTVNNAFNFDDISSFEYARFVYVPNAATGTFSLIVNK